MEKKYYYQVHLEVAFKGADFVFGFINISHISYQKFEELFFDQITNERFLFDDGMSYFIELNLYNKHKEFLNNEIPFTFNFDLFEYSVALTGDDYDKRKQDYYNELPPSLVRPEE